MKLGYLSIPPQRVDGDPMPWVDRAALARQLGFSEFYVIGERATPAYSTALNDSPAKAEFLRILPDLREPPAPQIVFGDGQVRTSGASDGVWNSAAPSQTAEHVKSLAWRNQAPLSVSWLTNAQPADHWSAHVTGSTHAGLRARPEDWRVARTVIVCGDPARAEAAAKSEDSPCRACYSKMAEKSLGPAQLDSLTDACVLCGTLPSVLEELHELAAASGPFGTLTLVDHAWPDAELARQSMSSLANAVAPHFRRNCVTI